MSATTVVAESLLALDIGSVNTRAVLFDVTDDQYTFVAVGVAPSTAGAPFNDVSEGIRLALGRLQEITGRVLVGNDERLILPSLTNGSGVDKLVATFSTGAALQTVVVGQLDEVSLVSAEKLAASNYTQIRETLDLNDHRLPGAQVDAILRCRPDLIILAGGTEGGASRSVMKLVETLSLACHLLPANRRPDILFVGNHALEGKVKAGLEKYATVQIAPNIRPSFDLEDLSPARDTLAQIVTAKRVHQVGGLGDVRNMTNNHLLPTSHAFGRMIRYMSLANPSKGVLGVDIGAAATTLAAAFDGKLELALSRQLGMGQGLAGVLPRLKLEEITRWLPVQVPEDALRDYLNNKAFRPAGIPATIEDLAVEQALARYLIRQTVVQAARLIPYLSAGGEWGLTRPFDYIVAGGAVLTQAPTLGESLLMLLDGLEPVGISTIILDQNNITSALGVAAEVNSIVPVQLFESGAYTNLGTVITPICRVRYGTPVCRIRIMEEGAAQSTFDIKYGALQMIHVPRGKLTQLQVEPLHGADVGFGRPGRGGTIRVSGGLLGVVVDARGRPLRLPDDEEKRLDLVKKWLAALGG